MQKKHVKAVLFDYGGVLAEEGFRNGLVAMATEQGLDVEAIPGEAMRTVYDSGFVLGQGTVTDFWALLRERTGLEGEDDALTQRILDGFVLRPWIIELVKQLRKHGYITGILSDQTHWLDWLNNRDHFYYVFDHIFNSYYMGKGKRDPGLFNDIASKLSLEPATILFIDDTKSIIERASEAGWQTIRYIDKESFLQEIEPLME